VEKDATTIMDDANKRYPTTVVTNSKRDLIIAEMIGALAPARGGHMIDCLRFSSYPKQSIDGFLETLERNRAPSRISILLMRSQVIIYILNE
jgi:hypothetical protein